MGRMLRWDEDGIVTMKNNYYANIIMCESSSKDFSMIQNIFNEIDSEGTEEFNFDIICELNGDIKYATNVLYVLLLRRCDDENKVITLAKLFRKYDTAGRNHEVTRASFKNLKIDTKKMWNLEIRIGEDISREEVEGLSRQQVISKTDILSRYVFEVK